MDPAPRADEADRNGAGVPLPTNTNVRGEHVSASAAPDAPRSIPATCHGPTARRLHDARRGQNPARKEYEGGGR